MTNILQGSVVLSVLEKPIVYIVTEYLLINVECCYVVGENDNLLALEFA